jgi:squalene-hopene/tetraprenyl-beta-curcumene cyclase
LRRHSLALCAEWILKRQEADGCWGGIQPPWVYSIMALHLLGYSLDHPALRKGLDALESFAIRENGMRRFEACQSPVWDTCLAMVALRDAGVAKDDPAMLKGGAWLIDEEIRVPGDWSVKRPNLEPSGWAFEFDNDNYPDIDDTAEVILALRASGADPAHSEAAVRRAIAWTFGMQCRDGGFAAFDVDNTSALCGQLPFCDFGEVTDPPSADVVAHVLEMLAEEGLANDPRTLRARDWLLRAQEPDGSWFGRWGINYVYGTGAAVPALVRAGIATDHASIRRAVRWLETHQNTDGGWGEDPRSYEDAAFRGRGASTPSQTAWALLALLAAGERGSALERGVAWLVQAQREDGDWDEPQFTGTGFPGDFYIRYHLYRLHFPVMALGRYLREVA